MKTNKIYVIAAICCIIGLVVFTVGFALSGFDFSKLSTEPSFEEKSYTSVNEVNALLVHDDNIEITLSASSDDRVHITYAENDKHYYDIAESADGTLSMNKKNSMKWTDYIFNISFEVPTLTIQIPSDFAGDISVETQNGDIVIDNVNARGLTAKTSNQGITVKNADITKTLDAQTSNGNIQLNTVSAGGAITCKTNNGKVVIENVTGDSLDAESNNGKIILTAVTMESSLYAETSNNKIAFDRILFGTELTCITNNGSITGNITGKLGDFSFDCKTSNGSCNLPKDIDGGEKSIRMKSSNGDIDVSFAE